MFANFATKKQPVQFAKKLKMEGAEPKDDENLQKTVSTFLVAEHIDVQATVFNAFWINDFWYVNCTKKPKLI